MIWITRPALEKDDWLSQELIKQGKQVHHFPLLDVMFEAVDFSHLEQPEALVVTSRNGVRGAVAAGLPAAWFELPLFAVGRSTGEFASQMEFQRVRVPSSEGGVSRLIDFILQERAALTAQRFLHVRGDQVAGDLKAGLGAAGLCVDEVLTYRMVERLELDQITMDFLKNGRLQEVVLLSPRTAQVYGAIMQVSGMVAEMGRMRHFCLSSAVAQKVEMYGLADVQVAEAPTLSSLVKLIGRFDSEKY